MYSLQGEIMTTTETASSAGDLSGHYTIDPAHSRIGFIARHAMITKVRGSFNEFAGEATLDLDNPVNSALSLEIQAGSIDTRNKMRDDHLVSNDFLDVPTFPTITFASSSITPTVADGVLTSLLVQGSLTIKGVSRAIEFVLEYTGSVVDPYNNHRVGLEGQTSINRSDWGVSWNGVLEAGGVMISEAITLEFEVSAILEA
jgi:polyisoprenoid-binding protein YceI